MLPIDCSISRGTFPFPVFWILHLSNVHGNTNNRRGNSLLVVDILSLVFLFLLNALMPFKDSARQHHVGSLSPQHSITPRAWWKVLPPSRRGRYKSEDSERCLGVQWWRGYGLLHTWAAGFRVALSLMRPAKGKWDFSHSLEMWSKEWWNPPRQRSLD